MRRYLTYHKLNKKMKNKILKNIGTLVLGIGMGFSKKRRIKSF